VAACERQLQSLQDRALSLRLQRDENAAYARDLSERAAAEDSGSDSDAAADDDSDDGTFDVRHVGARAGGSGGGAAGSRAKRRRRKAASRAAKRARADTAGGAAASLFSPADEELRKVDSDIRELQAHLTAVRQQARA
jgi:hypothetical protein